MSLFRIFDIAGSALNAESMRLNLISSNLANADTVASNPEQAYRARQPVFSTILSAEYEGQSGGVQMTDIVESQSPLRREYRPDHPSADEQGFISLSNVNAIEEMVNMVSATRSYQTNIELINSTKQMLLKTLNIGR
jgi:flagellar basal-body rod protein FlgC